MEQLKKQTEDSVHYLRDTPILNDLVHSDMEASDTLKRLIAEFNEQDGQGEVKNTTDDETLISKEKFEPDSIQNDPFLTQADEKESELDQVRKFRHQSF